MMNKKKMDINNNVKIDQRQKLTPQMLIEVELLQKPILELSQSLQNELMLNPFLEDNLELEEEQEQELTLEEEEEESEEEQDLADKMEEITEILNDIGEQQDEIFDQEKNDKSKQNVEEYRGYEVEVEDYWQYFKSQAKETAYNDEESELVDNILNSIDENGYLMGSLEKMISSLNILPERAEKIHYDIMHIYPKGIGARTLSECLLAQLEPSQLLNKKLVDIIRNDIEALEKKQFNKLSEKYKISQSELKAINEVIKHLDPKPRTRLYSSQPSYIQPDVIVKKICDELTVIINEPDIPQIRVNKKYAHQLLNKSKNKSDSIKYIRRKILAAEHYVEALWLRRESLDMIANEIVNQQPKFFLEGIKELDPMTYEDVAANIKRDVSTVCRVVKGKFMDTTYGIFPLKWFFNSSVGENSSQKVKKELLRIIKSEDKNKPLSDRKIKNKLKEKNIEISVRGVNKYRNQLGIPSSRLRKE